jgi:hypothetical protein
VESFPTLNTVSDSEIIGLPPKNGAHRRKRQSDKEIDTHFIYRQSPAFGHPQQLSDEEPTL